MAAAVPASFSIEGEAIPPAISEITKLGLDRDLLMVACSRGMTAPLTLQKHLWPVVIRGRSVVCVSKRNSGKTVGYILPLLNSVIEAEQKTKSLKEREFGPIALILVSTPEVADRIGKICTLLTSYEVNCVVLHSKISERAAYSNLLNGCSILVATPQSFLRALLTPASHPHVFTNLRRLAHLVIDEADVLLSNSKDSVTKILREASVALAERQTQGGSSMGMQFIVAASECIKDVEEFYESLTPYQPILIKGAGL